MILGGGRSYFTPNTVPDVETGVNGRRRDGKNLVNEWKTAHPTGKYVTTRDELLNLDVAGTDAVFGKLHPTIDCVIRTFTNLNDLVHKHDVSGLFSPAHMEYFVESTTANNPTLEQMTRTAIRMLQKETNGYILLVEG